MVELDREQQVKLLKLARNTIRSYLDNKPLSESDFESEFPEDIFREQCGAFVTLHIKGRLRGCIGYIQGVKPIPETIVEMSRSSAFKDPRFPPLSNVEFEDVDFEISVLSPIERVHTLSDIAVGRDGLIISHGMRSGLLLPQVATENNWDVEQFLTNTCYKAGLPGDAWNWGDIKIEKFSAQVFSEKELGLV